MSERTQDATRDPPVATMLLEACEDAVEAFKLLRMGVPYDPSAIAMINVHIYQLEYAIARAKGEQP